MNYYNLLSKGEALVHLSIDNKVAYNPCVKNSQQLVATVVLFIEGENENLFVTHDWYISDVETYLTNRYAKLVHKENGYKFYSAPAIRGRLGLSKPCLGIDILLENKFSNTNNNLLKFNK